VTITDAVLTVRVPGQKQNGADTGRGQVDSFSDKSRKRLFDWLNEIDWQVAGLPLFVSLTYGQEFPDPRQAKLHLRSLWMRLRRLHEKCGVLWKLEFQNRGAPHFHLLVFGPTFIDMDRMASMWGEVVGQGYWDHSGDSPRPPFTRVEALRSVRGVKWYCGKYIAKELHVPGMMRRAATPSPGGEVPAAAASVEEQGESPWFNSAPYSAARTGSTSSPAVKGVPSVGRIWGVMGREFVPRLENRTLTVAPLGDWIAALRVLASMEWKGIKTTDGSMMQGFTLYLREGDREVWEQRVADALRLSAHDMKGSDHEDAKAEAFKVVRELVREEANSTRDVRVQGQVECAAATGG